jgi:hypothetical protein
LIWDRGELEAERMRLGAHAPDGTFAGEDPERSYLFSPPSKRREEKSVNSL